LVALLFLFLGVVLFAKGIWNARQKVFFIQKNIKNISLEKEAVEDLLKLALQENNISLVRFLEVLSHKNTLLVRLHLDSIPYNLQKEKVEQTEAIIEKALREQLEYEVVFSLSVSFN